VVRWSFENTGISLNEIYVLSVLDSGEPAGLPAVVSLGSDAIIDRRALQTPKRLAYDWSRQHTYRELRAHGSGVKPGENSR